MTLTSANNRFVAFAARTFTRCGSTAWLRPRRLTATRITLDDWDRRYAELRSSGLRETDYGGPLRRHVAAGNVRLRNLRMDNSAAALRLWNFLLTEEERLQRARALPERNSLEL